MQSLEKSIKFPIDERCGQKNLKSHQPTCNWNWTFFSPASFLSSSFKFTSFYLPVSSFIAREDDRPDNKLSSTSQHMCSLCFWDTGTPANILCCRKARELPSTKQSCCPSLGTENSKLWLPAGEHIHHTLLLLSGNLFSTVLTCDQTTSTTGIPCLDWAYSKGTQRTWLPGASSQFSWASLNTPEVFSLSTLFTEWLLDFQA